jgi:hypothetical protein
LWLVLFVVYEVYAALVKTKGDTLSGNVWTWFDTAIEKVFLAVFLLLAVFLALQQPEATLAGVFVLYALSGPLLFVTGWLFGWPRWAVDEADDEADEEEDDDELPRNEGGEASS